MNTYKVLGIRPNASLDEIKTAYESLANTYDISNYQGSSEEPLAEDKISELNTAYNSLINEYKYKDIRDLIENQQFLSAETQLNLISDKSSAEWNYLEGFVLLKKDYIPLFLFTKNLFFILVYLFHHLRQFPDTLYFIIAVPNLAKTIRRIDKRNSRINGRLIIPCGISHVYRIL